MLFDPRAKVPKNPELEKQSAVLFGKHVSKQKAIILFAFTMIACALPILLGTRMWESIPEVISSGRTFPNGKEDAIPRWAMVYGFPAFFCLLNAITHAQLYLHQKNMKLPPSHIRIMGRFGFSVFSVLFCVGMLYKAAGKGFIQPTVMLPAAVGLMVMMLGAHMYECPQDARISLAFAVKTEQDHKSVHRFAGICWLIGGLILTAVSMMTENAGYICVGTLVILGTAPIAYAKIKA